MNWPDARDAALRRDRTCQAAVHGLDTRCVGGLTVHHIIPRGMGGTRDPNVHDLDRLITLCVGHHEWVERNRAAARGLGLLKRRTP